MREKYPNTEFFLVRIFLYSVWIQENRYQKKLHIWALFTQWNDQHTLDIELIESLQIRDNTHMTFMKTVQFRRTPTPLSSYVQETSTPLTLDFQFQTNPPPLQMIINQLKENIIQRWLLYVIRSFLKVGFCFQYQLSNLVWLFIDFFPFTWRKPCSQNYFKKLKTSFLSSSYSEKMCWSRGWAEASLSSFWRLSTLLCAAQKYHKLFFIYNYSNL